MARAIREGFRFGDGLLGGRVLEGGANCDAGGDGVGGAADDLRVGGMFAGRDNRNLLAPTRERERLRFRIGEGGAHA